MVSEDSVENASVSFLRINHGGEDTRLGMLWEWNRGEDNTNQVTMRPLNARDMKRSWKTFSANWIGETFMRDTDIQSEGIVWKL